MAKNSFLLNDKWKGMFVDLPDEMAGQLIKAAFLYRAGEDINLDNPILSAVFNVIRAEIDENDKKYAERCRQNAENGSKGGRPKNQTVPEKTERFFEKAKKPDNDNDIDNDLKERTVLTDSKKESDITAEVVEYLNEKAGTKYKANSKATKDRIRGRVKEGFTLSDFKTVIDKKTAEWKGTEREQFLRPETLFAQSHFESYLNQPYPQARDKPKTVPFIDTNPEERRNYNAVKVNWGF